MLLRGRKRRAVKKGEPVPLYEYKCEACGKRFEVVQKFSDEPETKCQDEQCGGDVKRIIFTSAFDLKGSGWFKNG